MTTKYLHFIILLTIFMTWSMSSSAQPCTAVNGMGPGTYVSGAPPVTARFFSFTGAYAPAVPIGYMTNGMLTEGACLGNTSPCNLANYDFRCQTFSMGKYASFIFRQSKKTGADVESNYCTFATAMGASCRIRGATGLPVELMEFSLD